MKISGPPTNNVSELGNRPLGEAAGRARTADDAAPGDRIAVSDRARWLAELKAAVGDPLAVDERRVAELRQAIADGSFDPSPREIAESLLRELPGLGRR
jgi:negative regulator of flagellin synthesis FlgM